MFNVVLDPPLLVKRLNSYKFKPGDRKEAKHKIVNFGITIPAAPESFSGGIEKGFGPFVKSFSGNIEK